MRATWPTDLVHFEFIIRAISVMNAKYEAWHYGTFSIFLYFLFLRYRYLLRRRLSNTLHSCPSVRCDAQSFTQHMQLQLSNLQSVHGRQKILKWTAGPIYTQFGMLYFDLSVCSPNSLTLHILEEFLTYIFIFIFILSWVLMPRHEYTYPLLCLHVTEFRSFFSVFMPWSIKWLLSA
jgi:hypothetical protein